MDKYQQANELITKYGSIRAAASASGIPKSTLGDRNKIWLESDQQLDINEPTIGDTIKQDFKADSGTISTQSMNIRTPEEALAKAGIDTDVWMIDRQTISSWEQSGKDEDGQAIKVPLWAVKLWLKRKQEDEVDKFDEAFKKRIEELKTLSPTFPEIKFSDKKDKKYCYVLGLADSHIGKLARKLTSGGDEYNIKIAIQRIDSAVDELLDCVKDRNIEKIILPTMGDFFQTEINNMTTKGTSVDNEGLFFEDFLAGVDVLQRTIEKLMQICPNIEVCLVPGNHDEKKSFYLSEVLKARYHNTDNVEITGGISTRIYSRYYNTMFMFTHGNFGKIDRLPMVVATEQKKMFGECDFVDVYVGHLHTKKQMNYIGYADFNGVTINQLASLSGTDKWHFDNQFVGGNKMAQGILYSRDNGSCAEFYSRA